MVVEMEELKEKIACELKKIKYKSYVGTKYLIEAIYIIITEDMEEYDFKKDIYPILAKKYYISEYTVKSNIRNATDKMYYDCEENKLVEYMGYDLKPTPKRVIESVLKHIAM